MKTTSHLRPIAESLWCVDADVWERGIHSRLRTSVVRLAGGELWLYSPGPMDAAVIEALAALGEVRHLVAPNLNHHKFLRLAHERYPAAEVWGPPGLEAKLSGLAIEPLRDVHSVDDALHGVLLGGVPFSNEAVFHHRPSHSLICADFVQNIHDEPAFLTRQLWRAIGSWKTFGQNRYWRSRTKDHAAFAASTDVVESWGATRIVMAHGDILEDEGVSALRQALNWVRRV